MRDSVKGCTQIEENKDGEETGVSCHKVIRCFYNSSFCAVRRMETRLELFIKVIVGKVNL